MHLHHYYEPWLVVLSVVIAIFASYTALDLVNSISISKGKNKWTWLVGSSLAMGVGIWSMHFIGMLAFRSPGSEIYYTVPLLVLSIVVAIIASALALFIIATREPSMATYFTGSLLMGAAIAGMHYIGIASMELGAKITWNWALVLLSIAVAIGASYLALFAAFKLREDVSLHGFLMRGLGGVLLGFAIAGMHYVGMAAMSFTVAQAPPLTQDLVVASDGMATVIILATLVILGIALSGSNVDRALTRKSLMNEMLEQGIRARDEFVSVASHELRTPLTSMKLQTDLAIRQLSLPEYDKEKILGMLMKTSKNMDRLTRLVEDMLDISRASTGRLVFHKEDFDLTELTADVLERFMPLLTTAGCEVFFEPSDPAVGNWDRFRIEQVVTNLLSNAAKYAPGRPIHLRVKKEKNFATLTVRDEGKGIPEKDQKRIFQRFERVKETTSQTGLGLGLFIVSEIITRHGGTIELNSKINEGSEFVVRLPLG